MDLSFAVFTHLENTGTNQQFEMLVQSQRLVHREM